MRKAERLFQILTLLRGRRTVMTATQLAEILEVSERTIYRDIQAMSLSGIPIESETGIGYRLKASFSVPPIMFEVAEIEALLLGVRMVESWSNNHMATAASSALAKIHSVLPDKLHEQSVQQAEWIIVPKFSSPKLNDVNERISTAVKQQQVIHIDYQDEHANVTERLIWPLGLIYWGKTWTVVAWCTKRDDYRLFRLDRIQNITALDQHFGLTNHINLQYYMDIQRAKYECD
jgi:predicted DNA-binding transcriptional regulator YafY